MASIFKNPFKRLFDYGILLFGLILLAVMLLATSLGLIVICFFSPRKNRVQLGRITIMRLFRRYLAVLHGLNIVRVDLSEIDQLRSVPGLILAPNHPSLLDALLVTSRLPNVVCVMKAQVLKSILFGQGARIAGYIPNGSVRDMVNRATVELRNGSQLLLFPEGTRSQPDSALALKGSLAVIAKRADAAVQTLLIQSDSGFLGKSWPLHRLPRFPVHFQVSLGRRFPPPQDVKLFMSELEAYFKHDLMTKAVLAPPAQATADAMKSQH